MEVTQIGRRILAQRWWLILISVLIVAEGVLLLERGQPTTYTANARLVLDTQDPTTRQEAAAIADTAKAIATSQGQVTAALKKAGATGLDPVKVAESDITVSSLGSSGLLQLSVKDRSPGRAAAIANALADGVIQTRLDSTRGDSRTVLADLDKRLADVRTRIARADANIVALNARAAGAPSAERDAATRQRQSLSTQEGVLESERVSLLTVSAAKPRPDIVSSAIPPAHADPSDLAVHIVLGCLLGLILGIGLSALLEVLRPTVVGGDAVAREFQAPLLGTLRSSPDREGALGDLTRMKSRLSLAMGAARIPSLTLLAAGPEVDLRPLAARLAVVPEPRVATGVAIAAPGGAASSRAQSQGEAAETGSGGLRVHAGATGGVPATNGHPVGGIVVVAPSSMWAADVVQTNELLRVGATPVVGVISYDRPRRARTSRGEA
jgi:capsular polysaccharide biosynthesis protein